MANKQLTIVGMGTGISRAVAERFGREGFSVAMLSRSPDKLTDLAQQLASAGITARSYPADASDATSLQQAFDAAHAEMGTMDVLLYNVAAVTPAMPSELDPDTLMAHFRVNVAGALRAAQLCLPAMRAKGGTMLFTGGGLALNPRAEYSSLAAGKAALRNLVFSLHEELSADGIHVGTVTVGGYVEPGGPFAPVKIAEAFWQLHTQPQDDWEREIIFDGKE